MYVGNSPVNKTMKIVMDCIGMVMVLNKCVNMNTSRWTIEYHFMVIVELEKQNFVFVSV